MTSLESTGYPLHQAAVMSLVSLSLLQALCLVVQRARRGTPLDDEQVAAIRTEVIAGLKDSGVQGIPIEHEAAAMREALGQLEQLLDVALGK